MRTILGALIILFCFSVDAQSPRESMKNDKRMEKMKTMTPEQQATLWSKKMTLDLDLTETQQNQIYALVLKKTKKQQERRANRPKERPSQEEIYQNKVEQLDEKIAMRNEMKSILTSEQYEKWNQSAERKERLKKRQLKRKKEGEK